MRQVVLSPEKIWDLAQERRKEPANVGRIARYRRALDYYWGRQARGGDGRVWAMNNIGRPLLRVQAGASMDIKRTVSINRTAPIVNDEYAMLGRLPTVRTDVPAHDEPGVTKAALQDKYLYSTYEMCQMEYQQAQNGFFLSCLGDACYALEVDWDHDKRVVASSIDPQFCFPTWFRGHRKFELYDLIICYYDSDDILERDFGYRPPGSNMEQRMVVTYLSPYQRTVVIGEDLFQPFPTLQWNLGFCPAVWMQSYITDGALANSNITHLFDLQDVSDFNTNMMLDGIVGWTYGLVGIKNPITQNGNVTYGPGEMTPLAKDGDIIVRPAGGDPSVLTRWQSEINQDINIAAGTSTVRQQGMPDRSNISGHAIRAAQGPESTRLDLKQVILGRAFAILNSYTFAMQETAPLLGKNEFEINGRYKGKAFVERFRPDRDIDGWYRNSVTWDSLLGMSKQQRIAAAGQAKALRLQSDRGLMTMIGVDDPEAEREEIERDIIREAEVQARAQLAAQKILSGAGEGGPAGAAQPESPSPPSQGPPGGSSPTARPVRPPSMPGPSVPAGASPLGVTLDQVKQLLDGLPLKGQAFAVGELAMNGRSMAPSIAITEARDYGRVLEAMRTITPTAKIRYSSQSDLPFGAELVA